MSYREQLPKLNYQKHPNSERRHVSSWPLHTQKAIWAGWIKDLFYKGGEIEYSMLRMPFKSPTEPITGYEIEVGNNMAEIEAAVEYYFNVVKESPVGEEKWYAIGISAARSGQCVLLDLVQTVREEGE